ncbi:hypothetical protein [Candidatus Nitrospira bockiana]
MRRGGATIWLSALVLSVGCTTASFEVRPDSEELLLDAPREEVKRALVTVLEVDGYPVRDSGDDPILSTGYRRETSSPVDSLLRSRFGVMRSRVEALLSSEPDGTTKLTLSILYEQKDHLWSAWQEAPAPPHRAAELYVRSLKQILGLL